VPRRWRNLVLHDGGKKKKTTTGGRATTATSQFYHVSVDQPTLSFLGRVARKQRLDGRFAITGGKPNNRWEKYFRRRRFLIFLILSAPYYVLREAQAKTRSRESASADGRATSLRRTTRKGSALSMEHPHSHEPNEKGRPLYRPRNSWFRSRDHGQNWDQISPRISPPTTRKAEAGRLRGVTIDNSDARGLTPRFFDQVNLSGRKMICGGDDERQSPNSRPRMGGENLG